MLTRVNFPATFAVADTRYGRVALLVMAPGSWGPIYKIPYDYLKIIVRSTYDSDLKRAKISLRNIVSYFTNTFSDDLIILRVNDS